MKKYIFILILLPLVAFQTHKYYLSLTKIEYQKETKSIQITARIFIDDLETAFLDIAAAFEEGEGVVGDDTGVGFTFRDCHGGDVATRGG